MPEIRHFLPERSALSVSAPTTRTRLAPEARKAQLLDCALAAFAEHGVARATHSHVAERAGVSIILLNTTMREKRP